MSCELCLSHTLLTGMLNRSYNIEQFSVCTLITNKEKAFTSFINNLHHVIFLFILLYSLQRCLLLEILTFILIYYLHRSRNLTIFSTEHLTQGSSVIFPVSFSCYCSFQFSSTINQGNNEVEVIDE